MFVEFDKLHKEKWVTEYSTEKWKLWHLIPELKHMETSVQKDKDPLSCKFANY